ncbi:MAG TPA: glycoside hydrolase family 32 protein [Puia sp.]|nr:glycoside hydrolase family 32 protein [Puia sp.]
MKNKYFHYFVILLLGCSRMVQAQNATYTEKYRPRFHFTPAINWTNDPNGLVYYKGTYHLFYQYNPYGIKWGHMSWGHAESHDLIHWKHLPVALTEKDGTMIFSGSAVIDEKNTTGFGKKENEIPMVAIYTGHYIADSKNVEDYLQSQQVAYSLDDGKTWIKYSDNPVLDMHKKDFRDPCVFWYEPGKKWVMAVVLPHEHITQFYSSPNLKKWEHLSDFGPAGDVKDIWECPSLLQVPIAGSSGKKKWVLFNSQQTTMQYFVGEFDGTHFVNENPSSNIYRPDYGPDYYAGITYNHLPENHLPILMGWANNWTYGADIPTYPWRSMMGLPRELILHKKNNEWILYQQPVSAVNGLRKKPWSGEQLKVVGEKELPVRSQQCEISLSWAPSPNSISGLRLAHGKQKGLIIGYDEKNKTLFMDRQDAGASSFNEKFAHISKYETKLEKDKDMIRLDIFFDHSIVEVFANGGESVMTMQIFPDEKDNMIQLFSEGASNNFLHIKFWELDTSWVH